MSSDLLSGDRHRLCLLCLSSEELSPIFSNDEDNLAGKIYDCIAVKINNVDGVPALICQLCRSRVNISHDFVVGCQTANRKYHRLFEPQFRQHRRLTQNEKRPAIPPKIPIKTVANEEVIPAKHAIVQRLKNDDKPRRRHSVDPVRKVKPKPEVKRHLSAESHLSRTSIKMMAAEIEQALSNDPDRKKCPKCGLWVKNLPKHLVLHSTISKSICEVCNKVFAKRSTLKYHMNLHTGAKPYCCRECGKRFTCPSKIWMHRQNNSDCASSYERRKSYRYQCNACPAVFKHRESMDQHMSSNHPDRKYSCETCGKIYLNGRNLSRHRKLVHQSSKSNPNEPQN